MNILISGCYGTDNVGDEMILQSLVEIANEKYGNTTMIASSIDPKRTEDLHSVNDAIPTIERDPVQWVKTVRSVDMILLGGGSVIGGDFIYRHSVIIAIAKLMRIPVGYAAAGTTTMTKERLRVQCLQNVDFIMVRDSGSLDYVSSHVPSNKVSKVADPAYYNKYLNSAERTRSSEILICGKYIPQQHYDFDVDGLVNALDRVDECWEIKFLPCKYTTDRDFCLDVSERLDRRSKVIDKNLNHREFQERLSTAALVIGVRLHSIIMSIRAVTPVVGISYHPKCTNALLDLDADTLHTVEDINSEQLYTDIDTKLKKGVTEHLKNYSREQSKSAATIYDKIETQLRENKSERRVSRLHLETSIAVAEYLIGNRS